MVALGHLGSGVGGCVARGRVISAGNRDGQAGPAVEDVELLAHVFASSCIWIDLRARSRR